MAVQESIVWNLASRAAVPRIRDTSHIENWTHSGTCGSRVCTVTTSGAASETQSLDMLAETLERSCVLQKMPRIGPPEFRGTSEGQFTKRTVSWSVDGFHWGADNSHGEKVVRY